MNEYASTCGLKYKGLFRLRKRIEMSRAALKFEKLSEFGKRVRISVGLLAAAYLISFCVCTTSPGGTDFPNTKTAVVGRITNEDGSAGSSTIVRLLPHDFNPLTDTLEPIADSTDSRGCFAFALSAQDSGTYNLHALNLHNGTRLMVRSIEVDGRRDTFSVGEKVLGHPGAILVALPESVSVTYGYVYLQGTPFTVPVAEGKRYVVLDSIPAGIAPSIYLSDNNAGVTVPVLIRDSVEVISGDTTLVAPEKGKSFIKLFLNTTETGAGVSENIYGFPIALRLASLPVAMGEMAEGGGDLLITDSDMAPLPMEIETWDSEAGDALVWVLVDTVFGNNATQFLYLFWGNDRQETAHGSAVVFETAQGYSAVWHLNGGSIDATDNGHDGGGVSDTPGILGGAQQFHGDDSIVIPGLLDTPSTVTLSAWAKLDSAVEKGAEMVSIGDAVLIRMDDYWNKKGCQGSYYSYPDSVDTMTHAYLGSGKFLADSGWHFFTYAVDKINMVHRFYIDGDLCCEKQMAVPIHYDNIGTDVVIGDHGNKKGGWNFIGSIDEVRVEHTIRSAVWIRLCYMNQNVNNKLIYTKP
ncbi:MAG: DUF2341 domain-containing protein [Chitinispirillaceae bacterium]|nr:DUF2341 domain-containing protein [Chitinispirillaceae bacterium]